MSRSEYSEDCDDEWQLIMWRGAVKSALRGKRGQAFLRELIAALDAMPEKKLIDHDLVRPDGAVCAIGAVGLRRGIDMTKVDPENHAAVAEMFGIADAMAREIFYLNDEAMYDPTPEARWAAMRQWAERNLVKPLPHHTEDR